MWEPQPKQDQDIKRPQKNGRSLSHMAGASSQKKRGTDISTVWRQIVNVEDEEEDRLSLELDSKIESSLMNEDAATEVSYSTRTTFKSNASISRTSRTSFGSSTVVKRLGRMSHSEIDRSSFQSSRDRRSFQSSVFVKRFNGTCDLEPRDSFEDDAPPSFKRDGVVVAGVSSIIQNRRANEQSVEKDDFMSHMQVASILRNRAALTAGSMKRENVFDEEVQLEEHTEANEFIVNLGQTTDVAASSSCQDKQEGVTHNQKVGFKAGDKSVQDTPVKDDQTAKMPSFPHLPERPRSPTDRPPSSSSSQRMNFHHRRYSNGNFDVDATAKSASKYVAALVENGNADLEAVAKIASEYVATLAETFTTVDNSI